MKPLASLACLLSLGAAAGQPLPPIVLTLPAAGATKPVAVGGAAVTFRDRGGTVQLELSGLTAAQLAAGTVEVSPPLKPGSFRTRRLVGQRFKCLPGSERERWLDEAHDDVASTRVSLATATPVPGGHALELPVQRFVSPVVRELSVRLALAGVKSTVLLRLEGAIELGPVYAELLRQYQRLGPALLRVSPGAVGVGRVRTDLCGDSTLEEEVFDEKTITVLAYPTPDWRLATAHGWVFAQRLEPNDVRGVPPLSLSSLDVAHVTFLGDPYQRELTSLTTAPGRATAVFRLGDFSGCFGAGCGDAVNVREAHVTLADGVLSTRLVRPPRE